MDKYEPDVVDAQFTDVSDPPVITSFPEPVSTEGKELVPISTEPVTPSEPEHSTIKSLEVIAPEEKPLASDEKNEPVTELEDDEPEFYEGEYWEYDDDDDEPEFYEGEYWEYDDDDDEPEQYYGGHPDAIVHCVAPDCGREVISRNAYTVDGIGPLGPECVQRYQEQQQQQSAYADDYAPADYAYQEPYDDPYSSPYQETYQEPYQEPASTPDYSIATYSNGACCDECAETGGSGSDGGGGGAGGMGSPLPGDWGSTSSQANDRYQSMAEAASQANQSVAQGCGSCDPSGGGLPGGGCVVFNGPVYIENMTVNCGGEGNG